jgi:hypothetical protein
VQEAISEAEHDALVACPYLMGLLRRRRYGSTHWDAVISDYRELELMSEKDWSDALRRSINRWRYVTSLKLSTSS